MSIGEKTRIHDFSRGVALAIHQFRLLRSAFWILIGVSLLMSLLIFVTWMACKTSAAERNLFYTHLWSRFTAAFYPSTYQIPVHIRNEVRLYLPQWVLKQTLKPARVVTQAGYQALWWAAWAGGTTFLTLIGYGLVRGRVQIRDDALRGARLLFGPELACLVRARKEASPYEIAGVPLRAHSETLHILMSGAQGTGKSQQFFSLMRQVRQRGQKMMVYDPSSEFTRTFYRPGIDILMNPLDARSPNWNPWAEVQKNYHFDNLAQGLFPDPIESEPFWSQASRIVFKEVCSVLGDQNRRSNHALYQTFAQSSLNELYTLLQHTAAASYVDPGAEKTALSLKMTVQNQLEAFRLLHDTGPVFSIRDWVHADQDAWVFITTRESVRSALKPILSLWINIAIQAVLDLEPTHQERLWFAIDELPTLQKIDILGTALTNTRKYGLCMVLGVQDLSQLYQIYGPHLAKTIISGCQTKLILRITDGASAKLLSELLGQAEVDEKQETLSYGIDPHREGLSLSARRTLRHLVLGSEILALPDMTGYFMIAGDYPIARVSYPYQRPEQHSPGFVERASVLL